MQPSGYAVYIVEDDQSVRDSLGLLLGLQGYPVMMFASAEGFLDAFSEAWRGCLLIDIRMPGLDGLALQKRLAELGCKLPVIVMTGHGSVDAAREAFRSRAIDFLEKPIDHDKLTAAITEAFNYQAQQQAESSRHSHFSELLKSLTPREKEVMDLVVTGRHNREIAESLGISARTVEVHKTRVMTKLNVDNVADLVRLSLA